MAFAIAFHVSHNFGQSAFRTARLVAAQRNVAKQSGVAFWSTYEAMGGEGSMAKWVNKGLAGGDLTHPTPRGAEVLGDLFYESITTGFDAWASRHPGVVAGKDESRQWLCTYKIALRLWPDAPGHKLQELRYFLKLDEAKDFESKLALPSHRAGPDAYVGCHLLRKVLAEAEKQGIDHERMVKWSKGPALLYMCFLKKHKGTPWSQVPKDYLDWIVNKSDITDRDIRATAKFYLAR